MSLAAYCCFTGMILPPDGAVNQLMSLQIRVNAICAQQVAIVMPFQKCTSKINKRHRKFGCQQRNLHAVHLLPTVNGIHTAQPVQNVGSIQVPADPIEIALRIQRRQGQQNGASTLLPNLSDHLRIKGFKFFRRCIGLMADVGVL